VPKCPLLQGLGPAMQHDLVMSHEELTVDAGATCWHVIRCMHKGVDNTHACVFCDTSP
jgi:hypothetical protein